MKKNLLFSLVAASSLLIACNGKTEQTNTAEVVETVETAVVETPDGSIAQTSLDYKGTYKGTLPTASGSGMEVTIVLADSTYTKELVYIGEKGNISTSGAYTWNKEGNTITLVGTDSPNQYFVGENTLTQLDVDGNKITGAIADQYILKK